jgi:Rrf2 family protein
MINRSVEYAIIIIQDLKAAKGQIVRLQDISHKRQLSMNFLEQISRKLRIEGILVSSRGPGGGYTLSKGFEGITLLKLAGILGSDKELDKLLPVNQHFRPKIEAAYSDIII